MNHKHIFYRIHIKQTIRDLINDVFYNNSIWFDNKIQTKLSSYRLKDRMIEINMP